MSTHTPNFNLIKLELTDPADITQMNKNWDTIDEELEKCAADIPVTSEVPEESNIWIDPNEETIEEAHVVDKNNPHGVTATQVGAYPAIEDTYYTGCYYRMVDGVKEWINPPMVLNSEYRTTERYNQYPVWTSIQSVKATYEVGGRCYCNTNIDATGFNIVELRRHDPDRLGCSLLTGGEKVRIDVENLSAESDANGTWFRVQLWYTKNSDTPTGGFG